MESQDEKKPTTKQIETILESPDTKKIETIPESPDTKETETIPESPSRQEQGNGKLFGLTQELEELWPSPQTQPSTFAPPSNDEAQSGGDDNLDKKAKHFRDYLDAGCPAGGSMGMSFRRAKDGGKSEKFKGTASTNDKKLFRQEWAQLQLEQVERAKKRFKGIETRRRAAVCT